jgi:hypothetical protein
MKTKLIRFSLLIVLLSAMPQMSSAATFVRVQNTNSSTTPEPKPISPCESKCQRARINCILSGQRGSAVVRERCAAKFRACVKRCTRR